MTDCDITDATLNDVAQFAVAHLPAGSEARVERGRAGLPHTLFVRAVGLDMNHVGFWDGPALGGTKSVTFYDRLAPTRWLLAIVEDAAIQARALSHEWEAKGVDAAARESLRALRCELGDFAGKLMSERHRLEAAGSALPRAPLGNIISAETCRAIGSTP